MTAGLRTSRSNATLIVTISAPETRNALLPEMVAAAVEIFSTAERDDSVRAIVLHGHGDAFCSGTDIGHLAKLSAKEIPAQIEAVDAFQTLVESVLGSSKPVIAAVEGIAAGTGFALALACDLIVAGGSARFSIPNVRLGMTTDGGSAWLLTKMLPRQAATEMLLSGSALEAERLFGLGLINRLTIDGGAFDVALSLAEECAAFPRQVTLGLKSLIQEAQDTPLSQHFENEKHLFIKTLQSRNALEGIEAFFRKRKPQFN